MPNLTDTFDPKLCAEMTGYTFRDVISMYEDYERMADFWLKNKGSDTFTMGWYEGQRDTLMAYRRYIPDNMFPDRVKDEILAEKRKDNRNATR
jgi:hypothetical protein